MASHCPSMVSGEWNGEYLREVACPKSEEGGVVEIELYIRVRFKKLLHMLL